MAGRPWTTKEIETLRNLHGTVAAKHIAPAVNRSAGSVRQMALKLGLAWYRHADFGPDFLAFLTVKNRAGWSDKAIAEAWGCNREAVTKRREAAGLPSQTRGEEFRRRQAKGFRRQCRESGFENLAELQKFRLRAQVAKRGWPIGLLPREADILDLLEQGPKTREQLCAGLGIPWNRRYALKARRPGGTYLAHLVKLGYATASRVKEGDARRWLYSLAIQRRPIGNPFELARYSPTTDEDAPARRLGA